MQARKPFGRLNDPALTLKTNPTNNELRRLLTYGLSLVAVIGIGALAFGVLLAREQGASEGDSTRAVASVAGEFSLVGLWANGGQTCDEAKSRFEFDGETFWMVSSILRVPIGPYKVSGSNPIVFEQSSVEIPLVVSNNGNSLEPLGYDDAKKTFHLTRC